MTRAPTEGARDLEVRNHDHHAEQQRDRVEVDGAEGFLQAQRAERDHRRPAQKGDAGPVEAQTGNAASRDAYIGQNEDRESGTAARGHSPIAASNAGASR